MSEGSLMPRKRLESTSRRLRNDRKIKLDCNGFEFYKRVGRVYNTCLRVRCQLCLQVGSKLLLARGIAPRKRIRSDAGPRRI